MGWPRLARASQAASLRETLHVPSPASHVTRKPVQSIKMKLNTSSVHGNTFNMDDRPRSSSSSDNPQQHGTSSSQMEVNRANTPNSRIIGEEQRGAQVSASNDKTITLISSDMTVEQPIDYQRDSNCIPAETTTVSSTSVGSHPGDELFVNQDESAADSNESATASATTPMSVDMIVLEHSDDIATVVAGAKRAIESIDKGQIASTRSASKRAKITTTYRSTSPQLEATGSVPSLTVYRQQFAKAENHVTQACDIFITAVEALKEQRGYTNKEIDAVCSKQLDEYRTPAALYPVAGPVTCLGVTGKGKSSAINAIMGETRAALEFHGGTEGKRGTYVVTEYRTARPDQLEKYRIEVSYLDAMALKKQVQRFCDDAQTHFAYDIRREDSDYESEDEDESMDEDARELQRKKAETALECLSDVLCREPKFATSEKLEAFFRRNSAKKLNDFFEDIDVVLEEVLAEQSWENDKQYFDAADDQALQLVLKQTTRATTSRRGAQREPSLWPFITKVEICYRSDILEAGVVLADTPGSGDKNLHVLENTYRSLKEAGTILIVADHLRLKDDKALDQHLRKCVQLGKADDVVLVVTKIDALPLYSEGGDREELSDDELSYLVQAEDECKILQGRIKEVTEGKEAAKRLGAEGMPRFMELDDTLLALSAQLPIAEANVKKQHIRIRCEYIKKQASGLLRQADKSQLSPSLKVFPVSSQQYQLSALEPRDKGLFLDAEDSGIPALQLHLLHIAAGEKLGSLLHTATKRLPWAFNGIEGILTKPLMERKAELRKVVVRCISQNHSVMDDLTKSVLKAFDETIASRVQERLGRWSGEASSHLVDDWRKMNGGTFKALCTRRGKWRHKKKGDFNLNKDIHDIFCADMDFAFKRLHDDVGIETRSFNILLRQHLGALCDDLARGQHSQGLNMEAFEAFIHSTRGDITFSMGIKFEALENIVDQLCRAFALEPEDGVYTDHLVGNAMESVYVECIGVNPGDAPVAETVKVKKGRGKKGKFSLHQARIHMMRSKLGDETAEDNIFRAVCRLGRDMLEEHLEEWAKECREIIEKGFAAILTDFDRRFIDSNEVKTEHDPEAIEILQEAVRQAMGIIDGPLKDCLEQCKAYEEQQQA